MQEVHSNFITYTQSWRLFGVLHGATDLQKTRHQPMHSLEQMSAPMSKKITSWSPGTAE